VLGLHDFNNAALFSYNNFQESKLTTAFGVNLNRYRPLLKSAPGDNPNISGNNNIISEMKATEIINDDNNSNKIKKENREIKDEDYKRLYQNVEFGNEIKTENIIDENIDYEGKYDRYDIFSSQNSVPSKSVNSKRRLVKRIKTLKDKKPTMRPVLTNLEEKENLKIDSYKDLEINRCEFNQEEKNINKIENKTEKGI
jgi:hypothetical protein